MKNIKFIIVTLSFLLSGMIAGLSEQPADLAVLANLKVDTSNGLKFTISWIPDSNAKQYVIKRKLVTATEWGDTLANLDSTARFFTDSSVSVGIGYEYYIYKKSVVKSDSTPYIYEGHTYICAGWGLKQPDYRGRLLLLVDDSIAEPLSSEINRLIFDLTGDGWNVVMKLAPRTKDFNKDSVQKTKQIITDEFNSNPDSLTAMILLGRIAVPYSGKFAADGHSDHEGAWAADTYYAVMHGSWTDSKVNDSTANRPENRNYPGDGKFDQNQIPSDVVIEAGRIDCYKLTYFGIPEVAQLKYYLNKDHDYRQGLVKPEYRCLIDDHFGMYGEAFASNAWMNYTALLGTDSVKAGPFVEPHYTAPRIWAYGCGPGAYNSIGETVWIDRLDTANCGAVFGVLFGSYNGDWDSDDNILRSYLAYAPYSLTCAWSGRPFWQFNQMGLGYPIGFCTKISQNNQYLYETSGLYGYRYVHVSLLGDPTLRMYVEDPPYSLQLSAAVSDSGSNVNLSWRSSADRLIGFNIYRSDDIYHKFIKINNKPVPGNEFNDNSPLPGRNIYMVRAVRERVNPDGMFYNMSQGVFAETNIPSLNFSVFNKYYLKCYPQPAKSYTNISFYLGKKGQTDLYICDVSGRVVANIFSGSLNAGYHEYYWPIKDKYGNSMSAGVYIVYIKSSTGLRSQKVTIVK